MKSSVYSDVNAKAHKQNKMLWCLVMMLAMISVTCISILAFRNHSVRTVIVPMNSKQPFWIENDAVSESYVADVAQFALSQYLTVTNTNSDENAAFLLRLAAPETEAKLKLALSRERDRIRHENLTTSFYPKSTEVDMASLSAIIVGRYKGFSAQHIMFDRDATFKVNFKLNFGKLQLLSVAYSDSEN